ncbi:MAG: hypothetical protein M1820_003260 [Bogoriella megaspora]|nr:MAG: hypothetical protein M1820_003260 [Bogoriella megaspora]
MSSLSSPSGAPTSLSQLCRSKDNSFGPYAGDCRGGFDFTLLFEETILFILPLAVLILIAPFRLYYLLKKQIKVVSSSLLYSKHVSFALFTVLQLVVLILSARSTTLKTKATVAAVVIGFIGALIQWLVSYVEHVRSVRPSDLLNTYLFISLLLDVARARTFWLRRDVHAIAAVFTTGVCFKAINLLLEATEKRSNLKASYKAYPPEATSSIFSRFFFSWQWPLFRKGFSSTLVVDDLFTLDKHLSSENLYGLFRSAWKQAIRVESSPSLFSMTFRILKWPVVSAVFPRLALTAFMYCQPFLIDTAVSLSLTPVDGATMNQGYGLIGASILVYVGIAVSPSSVLQNALADE